MSPEAQRIAIAEARGFRKISEILSDWEKRVMWATPRRYFRSPDSDYGKKLFPNQQWGWDGAEPEAWADKQPDWFGVPDYLNDLNAMHEAEMMLFLTHDQVGCTLYFDWLSKLTAISAYPNEFYACRASAAKRAEAFLRTLNLWDDSL